MESTKDTKLGGLQSTFSRRNLLKGTVALTAAASVPEAFGQQPTGAPRGTVWLYIGTYTGAPGGGGNGQGIYLCSLNLSTGKLTVLRVVESGRHEVPKRHGTFTRDALAVRRLERRSR